MKFIAVINRTVALGETINALAHMTLGLGHRLDGAPDVNIFFGDSSQVREFRTLASTLSSAQQQRSVFTDFPHTMSGGDTDKQLLVGASTSEADLKYYGSCYVADEIDPRLAKITQSCSQLVGYSPYVSKAKARLLAEQQSQDDGSTDKKICMLINGKIPIATTINAVVLSSLSVGGKAKHSDLRLLDVPDKDGNKHSNISFHTFPILKPESPAKHLAMAENAKKNNSLVSDTVQDGSQPLATVVFGLKIDVENVIQRKLTRLFETKLKDDELISVAKAELSQSQDKINAESKEEKKTDLEVKHEKKPRASQQFFARDSEAAKLKRLESIQDELSTLVRSCSLFELQKRLANDLELVKKITSDKTAITPIISEVLSEAAGSGKLSIVQYLLATYEDHIINDDLDHCIGHAEYMTKENYQDVMRILAEEQKRRNDIKSSSTLSASSKR